MVESEGEKDESFQFFQGGDFFDLHVHEVSISWSYRCHTSFNTNTLSGTRVTNLPNATNIFLEFMTHLNLLEL
jgi:hypothetical protein